MSQVQIQKTQDQYDFNDFLFGRWAERARKIEHRAYQLFEKRGHAHGRHFEDWLQAEREMNCGSTCEVDIGDKAITIVVSAPGFNARDLSLNIAPGVAIVEGEDEQEAMREKDGVVADEEITRSLFHQIPLPEAADIDAAEAAFHGDELRITIPLKAVPLTRREDLAVAKAAN